MAEGYFTGLERLAARDGDLSRVASVESFFVSRVDTTVDAALNTNGERELQGMIAIANARVAYGHFRSLFSGERWERLVASGARPQRPLWASTGTKNPDYPDTLYVDELIGPHTVNTVSPATLVSFLDHGKVGLTLEQGLSDFRTQMDRLVSLGIDSAAIFDGLLTQGLAAFTTSFETLPASIRDKATNLQ